MLFKNKKFLVSLSILVLTSLFLYFITGSEKIRKNLKKYLPEEYRPGIDINDDEELVKEASNYAQTIFHPVGTCKMGQDDMAVVDEKLRVKGIKNLRVIDASIMPNITSGNTNAPTIMIAEKGADMILEQ